MKTRERKNEEEGIERENTEGKNMMKREKVETPMRDTVRIVIGRYDR